MPEWKVGDIRRVLGRREMKKLIILVLILLLVGSVAAYENIPNDGKGILTIGTRAYNNIFSDKVLVWQGNETGAWFAENVLLNPNGLYEGRYNPGVYNLYLYDGNGGKPEEGTVRVDAGYTSRYTFIGHAAGTGRGGTEYACYTICIHERVCDKECGTEPYHCSYITRYEVKCGYFAQPLSETICYEDG